MSILAALFEPSKRSSYAPWDDFWYGPIGETGGNAALSLSSEQAGRIAAVYCARSILSETLAHVPLKVNRRLARGKEVANEHPLYRLLHDRANSIQTSMEWREQQMGDLVFRGNCYSRIVYTPQDFIAELRPLSADRMTPVKLPNYRLGYSFREDSGRSTPYTQDEIYHVRGYAKDGFVGMAPLEAMRQSLGLTLALETFGAALFKNGALHRGILKHPKVLKGEALEHLRKTFKGQYGGLENAHETMILEEGMSWEKTGMTSEDAQFLLSRKFQISEIARWFHVPPHLLGDLEKATFSNIEQQSLEFVIYTMVPWFVRWEQRINADLIFAPQTYFVEFVVDGLLRGDVKTRYEAYKSGIESGWLNRNEAREKESLNAVPGLDSFLVQQNMAMVDASGNVVPINKSLPAPPPGPPAGSSAAELDDHARERLEYFHEVFGASAERILRKEGLALTKALARCNGEPARIEKWADQFYKDHAKFIAEAMRVGPERAECFAENQKQRLLVSLKDNCAAALLKELENAGGEYMLSKLRPELNGRSEAA